MDSQKFEKLAAPALLALSHAAVSGSPRAQPSQTPGQRELVPAHGKEQQIQVQFAQVVADESFRSGQPTAAVKVPVETVQY